MGFFFIQYEGEKPSAQPDYEGIMLRDEGDIKDHVEFIRSYQNGRDCIGMKLTNSLFRPSILHILDK